MSEDLVVGGQLGSYLIESVIGRGGMSVVYRAKHARLGMPVALKVLAPELSSNDTFRERFLREAQMAATIDHPNVIPIHDMGLHEGSLYIIMRYVAGGDLKTLLTSSGPLDPDLALTLLTPIGLALDVAHARGLVHRDVKPANILIQRSDAEQIEHVYLTDFGIAKSASFTGALTGAGASIGTVGYMAPEQLQGAEVGAQTDVYALAVTFYECLTGRIPFQRELAEGIRPPTGAAEPVSRARPDLPPALDGVFAKALARSPADRYATCEEFLGACRETLAGWPPAAGAPTAGVQTVTSTSVDPANAPIAAGEAAAGAARPLAGDSFGGADRGGAAAPAGEPLVAASGAPGAGDPGRASSGSDGSGRPRGLAAVAAHRSYAALGALLIAAGIAVVVLSSGSSTPTGRLSLTPLAQVPTNHVTGTGQATVRLNGDRAAVTLTTHGLDDDDQLVHLMHIHAGGKGVCPPASAARLHNGHLAISTTDGINYYGPPVQALTTHGDTSVSSILAFPRFPSGGNLSYTRTITLPAKVVAAIEADNAVVVVHGVDYDGTGIYSGVLDPSELNKSVPGTATAPALCGPLVAAQSASASTVTHRRGRRLVFIASLGTPAVPPGGVYLCHVPAASATPLAERRRTSAGAA